MTRRRFPKRYQVWDRLSFIPLNTRKIWIARYKYHEGGGIKILEIVRSGMAQFQLGKTSQKQINTHYKPSRYKFPQTITQELSSSAFYQLFLINRAFLYLQSNKIKI